MGNATSRPALSVMRRVELLDDREAAWAVGELIRRGAWQWDMLLGLPGDVLEPVLDAVELDYHSPTAPRALHARA